jgi:hypothetical protein
MKSKLSKMISDQRKKEAEDDAREAAKVKDQEEAAKKVELEKKEKFNKVYYDKVYPALKELSEAISETDKKQCMLLDNVEYKKQFGNTGTACRDYLVILGTERNYSINTVEAANEMIMISYSQGYKKDIGGTQMKFKLDEIPSVDELAEKILKKYLDDTEGDPLI